MIKSKVLDLLRNLSPSELHELQLFVSSPYFNRGNYAREAEALIAFIIAASPGFEEAALAREQAYQAVFPGTEFVEGKLDKVMAELHKLAKQFVAIKEFAKPENEFRQLLNLAMFYRVHGQHRRYTNVIQKLEDIQKNTPWRDQDYFQRDFLLDYEILSYQSLYNPKRGDVHLQKTLESLEVQYLFAKTELLNMYMLQKKFAIVDMPSEITKTTLENQLLERYVENYPLLKVSYNILQLLEKQHVGVLDINNLHQLLLQCEHQIQPDLLKYYYTYLRNFCVLLVNSGRSDLLPVLFTFHKEHFTRGYMYYNDKISSSAFLSANITAFRLKEYTWAKDFITTHQYRVLGDNETQDFYRLNYANYLFHTGRFDEALEMLPPAFQAVDYHIFSRRLELKIYYEQESELLPYKIDAFKMYLSRVSKTIISSAMREQNTHFVNLLAQLSTSVRGDTDRAQRLIERIRAKQTVTEREWLLKKAEELA